MLYVYWTVHHCDSWRTKTNLMSLAILFYFLCAQHVSDINISIIRSLRLFCWITTLVVLFLVRYVLEFRCGWVVVQPNHTETPVLQIVECVTLLLINKTDHIYFAVLFIDKGNIGSHLKNISISDIKKHRIWQCQWTN